MSKVSHCFIIGIALLILGIGFIYCYWNYLCYAPARKSSNGQSPTTKPSGPRCGCSSPGSLLSSSPHGHPMFANQTAAFNGTRMGDMILQENDLKKMMGFQSVIVGEDKKWPRGEVRYLFQDALIWDDYNRKLIQQSLSELSAKTGNCVRFREIDSPDGNGHINIISDNGCYSNVGWLNEANGQPLSLALEGCMHAHIIQHEFIHALGFFHEQSRPDRQEHILVNWDNVETEACSNFKICRGCSLLLDYDRDSIMQYDGQAFSCNTKPTMIDKASKTPIKHNEKLTATDVLKIRRFYNCT